VTAPAGCRDGPLDRLPGVDGSRPLEPALEERIGEAIDPEARAGANFFGGVCINLPRHPAWGRIQEICGEDP